MSQPLPGDWEDGQSSSRPHSNTKQVSLAIPLVDQVIFQLPIGCPILSPASHWLLNKCTFFLSQPLSGVDHTPLQNRFYEPPHWLISHFPASYRLFLFIASFSLVTQLFCLLLVTIFTLRLRKWSELASTTLQHKTGFSSPPIVWFRHLPASYWLPDFIARFSLVAQLVCFLPVTASTWSRLHSTTKQVLLAIPLVDQSLPQLPIGCPTAVQLFIGC